MLDFLYDGSNPAFADVFQQSLGFGGSLVGEEEQEDTQGMQGDTNET